MIGRCQTSVFEFVKNFLQNLMLIRNRAFDDGLGRFRSWRLGRCHGCRRHRLKHLRLRSRLEISLRWPRLEMCLRLLWWLKTCLRLLRWCWLKASLRLLLIRSHHIRRRRWRLSLVRLLASIITISHGGWLGFGFCKPG